MVITGPEGNRRWLSVGPDHTAIRALAALYPNATVWYRYKEARTYWNVAPRPQWAPGLAYALVEAKNPTPDMMASPTYKEDPLWEKEWEKAVSPPTN